MAENTKVPSEEEFGEDGDDNMQGDRDVRARTDQLPAAEGVARRRGSPLSAPPMPSVVAAPAAP